MATFSNPQMDRWDKAAATLEARLQENSILGYFTSGNTNSGEVVDI